MNVTNNHSGPLGLPTGQELQPNVATPVHDWATIKQNAVVAAWLKAGILVEGEAQSNADDAPDRDELIAKLAALGIKHHPNTGVAKLQTLLAEAEEKAAEEANEKLLADVFAASGLDAEAWAALSDEDRQGHVDTYKAALAFGQS